MEYYCSYQERCHIEVSEKLRSFVLNSNEKSMESKIPYNYVSVDPVANFDNGFIQ